jgi:hypothetical protein
MQNTGVRLDYALGNLYHLHNNRAAPHGIHKGLIVVVAGLIV